MSAEIFNFPRQIRRLPLSRRGWFYAVQLADGLWWIDHEAAGAGSYGIVAGIGPFKLQTDAEAAADLLNAEPPDNGGRAA